MILRRVVSREKPASQFARWMDLARRASGYEP
jgi:hypothetical protein